MRSLIPVFVLLVARAAQAMCANPGPFVLPLEGSTVPPDPVLYLFVPAEFQYTNDDVPFWQQQLRDLWVSSPDGTALPFVMERIVDAEVSVYRISVRAAEGAQFTVQPFQTRPLTVAKATKTATLSVERGPEKNFRWTCSFESVRVLLPSLDAPAFRVRWAPDLAGLDRPEARTLIVPGRSGFFYRGRPGQPEPALALKLGHLNCAGFNLKWTEPIWVRLTALTADGREVTSPQALRLEPPPPQERLEQR